MNAKADYKRNIVEVELTEEELDKLHYEYIYDDCGCSTAELVSCIFEAIKKGEAHAEL